MTTTAMLLWIAVTTIYGYIMYKRGYGVGVTDFVFVLEETNVIKDKMAMFKKIEKFYREQDENDSEG
jgi:hypothetical protein